MVKLVIDRRRFLSLTGAALSAAPFHALACSNSSSNRKLAEKPDSLKSTGGYGPLSPVRDQTTGLPLLHLPEGFHYVSFGWIGDPLSDGTPTPGLHDGMAAFASQDSTVRLVRNHEARRGKTFASHPVYDHNAGGGTTTIEFDSLTGTAGRAWTSLAGTAVNCAGGPTPWGSWLSCEETIFGPGGENNYLKPHGYVFEVPSSSKATPAPLKAMGRFVHEAVAVDEATGIVYETEDANESGFYRFIPTEPGKLDMGGRLEMLALSEIPHADTRTEQLTDIRYRVTWIPIENPDPPNVNSNTVFSQGFALGGATFARLEGAWYGEGRIYFVSTNGGNAKMGQVWEYDPINEMLRLIFESPGPEVLNMPDNICVSPRGGLVLCEDGDNDQFVRGLTTEGEIFPFAKNNIVLSGERNNIAGDFRTREFAGATYSPDGRWLFINVQSPGITFAVTGPWPNAAL